MTMPENEVQPHVLGSAPQPTGVPPVTTATPAESSPSVESAVHTAGGSLRDVAQTAKDETSHVAEEAGQSAQQLWHQTRDELSQQAVTQKDRATQGLRTIGEELRSMSNSSDHPGMASDAARQAGDLATRAASWLEAREPGDLAHEITGFARRRPGTFLLAAAALGVAAGRLTRGMGARGDDRSEADAVMDLRDGASTRDGAAYAAGQDAGLGTDDLMPPMGPDVGAWTDTPSAYQEPAMPTMGRGAAGGTA